MKVKKKQKKEIQKLTNWKKEREKIKTRSLEKRSIFKFFQKKSSQGQGLVEYLILIALMGISTIVVIRLLNHTVTAKFTDIIYALQGNNKKSKKESVNEEIYKKKDLKNFMNGAASRKNETK